MACKYKRRVWQNGWCNVACQFCTHTQESTCEHNKQTNADRIRAMSDEELAEFIRDVSYECQDASWGCHCQTCSYPWCSSDQTVEWLKQPAEGE